MDSSPLFSCTLPDSLTTLKSLQLARDHINQLLANASPSRNAWVGQSSAAQDGRKTYWKSVRAGDLREAREDSGEATLSQVASHGTCRARE